MASNEYSATAANILSSLHIKGATTTGGADKTGCVPVIGDSGKLDISVIPMSDIERNVSISPLTKTAYVSYDPASIPEGGKGNGSIALPYQSVTEASKEGYLNYLVDAGTFSSTYVTFYNSTTPIIRITGIGSVTFSTLSLSGYKAGTRIILEDISVTGTLALSTYAADCEVWLQGNGSVGTLFGVLEDPDDETSAKTISGVRIGPNYVVSAFSNISDESISYSGDGKRIANSSDAPGSTVESALNSLAGRKIKIPTFSQSSSGIATGTPSVVSVSDEGKTYDITGIGTSLRDAANATFHKDGDSPEYNEVTADSIDATSINATSVKADTISLKRGNSESVIKIEDSFLVIA